MSDKKLIKVLFITDDPARARQIRKQLAAVVEPVFEVISADTLATGIETAGLSGADIAMMDVRTLDEAGAAAGQFKAQDSPIPLIVLVSTEKESLGREAVARGATDYLVRGQTEAGLLVRSIRYALDVHTLREAMKNLAMMDEPTGFYTRTGFVALAEHQLRIGRRAHKRAFLLRIAISNLAEIASSYGREEGENAIHAVVEILGWTFRSSDVLGRLGRDEFACLVYEIASGSTELIYKRLIANIKAYNDVLSGPYKLDLSIGLARIYGETVTPVEELLEQAGQNMVSHDAPTIQA
ncbi:MAG: diguanylate cyclase [Candidatus Sumerlaeaceae bacterium]|nr:diguanylate cyclase [Candidatus Sumerlaeaceae bacterium]